MKKYPIDPELKKNSEKVLSLNRFCLSMASLIFKLMRKPFDHKKYDVKYYRIGRVKIHIITPRELINQNSPLLFYIHGGGFVYRASSGYYLGEMAFASSTSSRVVGIDYDLAPHYPYPIALNECFDAYKFLLEHHEELNIDISRIALAGDSAGGNLVNELYLKIFDNNLVKPQGLVLIYPVIDNSMNTESMKKYIDTPGWNAVNNKRMWDLYLAGKEYISPLTRVKDFKDVKVYIETCEFDCLHDEGVNFYQALKNVGVDVILDDTKGTFHGYDINANAKITQITFGHIIEFLKAVFK